MADLPEYYTGQVPGAQVPGMDNRYQQILQGQKGIADQFRNKLPDYERDLGGQYEKQSRQNLSQNLRQVKKDFNSRGLLQSGGRYGAEANATQGANFDVAQGRYGINQALSNQADQLDQNYANTAYGMAGITPGSIVGQGLLQGQQNNLSGELSNNQALNDIFGGAGKGLGYIFSKYK